MRRSRALWFVACLGGASLVACLDFDAAHELCVSGACPQDDGGVPDAGNPPDDGGDVGPVDAGSDGGGEDAGWDAGGEDAGWDAGSQDAGWDAGGEDAGWDAGSQDAGWDAGLGCDAPLCLVDRTVRGRAMLTAWQSPSGQVYVGGFGGRMIRFDAQSWHEESVPAQYAIRGIGGTGDQDIWAGGSDEEFFHKGPGGWSVAQTAPSTISSLWVAPSGEAWATGDTFVSRFSGGTWTAQLSYAGSSGSLDPIASDGTGRVFVGGQHWSPDQAVVYVFADGGHTLEYPPSTRDINALVAVGPGELWGVGDYGSLLHRAADGGWTTHPVPNLTVNLFGVSHDPSSGTVWAVGTHGTILRRLQGGTWQALTVPEVQNHNLFDLVVSPPDDLWVVGAHNVNLNNYDGGVVFRFKRGTP
jgi:hypothetical protein